MTAVEKIARELQEWEGAALVDLEAEARRILALLEPEVREREQAAWMNHGEWMYHILATTGRLPSRDEAQAEAARRYPKEEKA
jgi:hypothetical protein